MMLADQAIRYWLYKGDLVIDPLLEPVQPASVDLRLGHELLFVEKGIIEPGKSNSIRERRETFEFYALAPGQSVNAGTLEWVEIPSIMAAKLDGKSSLARIHLQVEAAGYVDPGWKGRLTLELTNLGDSMIVLRPGMPICQIRFHMLSGPPSRLYGNPELGSHYQGSEGPVSARFEGVHGKEVGP